MTVCDGNHFIKVTFLLRQCAFQPFRRAPPHRYRYDSRKGHYVNGATNAVMKATGGSIGEVRSSCAELFSGTPVTVLHTPADCAEPLNVALAAAISDAGWRRSESAARPSGATTHEFESQGRWKQRGGMVGRYTRGETAGSALRYL